MNHLTHATARRSILSVIPEPSSLGLLTLLAPAALRRRRRGQAVSPTHMVLSVAALLLGVAVSTASATPSLTPLGVFPGSNRSYASGVSADGTTVVGFSGFAAFRWTSAGGMHGLGSVPGSISSSAGGVSGDGSVVVGSNTFIEGGEAFRWTSAGGMVGLGYLPGGGSASYANDISGDGLVIVGQAFAANRLEAFRWTSAGGMVGLGVLPGWVGSAAGGVNGNGSVVVGLSFGDFGVGQAFRWTSATGMQGLPLLPGHSISSANAVSSDGSTIVGRSSSSPDSRFACRWINAGVVSLGDLPGGALNSEAWGVSGDGSVIVGHVEPTSSLTGEAFYWTQATGMRRLWDVLLASGVNPAADGWTVLLGAQDVSFDGKTIVGTGIRNGVEQAFVATIPEPASLGLLILLAPVALRRRRHAANAAVPVVHKVERGAVMMKKSYGAIPSLIRAAGVAAILLAGAVATASAAPSLTPLGLLPGTISSEAVSVSADGSVVVGNATFLSGPNQFRKAWRWTPTTGMHGLGSLPGGMDLAMASAVSADGSTIVGSSNSSTSSQAFRWTSAGGMVSLGAGDSRAEAVTADGSVIVGARGVTTGGGGVRAFRWSSAGGVVNLPGLSGVIFQSAANGVSGDGSVIAGVVTAGFIEACRWTNGGPLEQLMPGTNNTWAYAISADGATIVGEAAGVGFQQGFRWTSDGGMVGLGLLPGTTTSSGIAVNGDGSVIVLGRSIQDFGPESYLWTQALGIHSLWDLLLANGLDPAADGWTTLWPRNLSPDGMTIVGTGIRNSVGEAFIAVIPEPTALGLLLPLAAAALLHRRRRVRCIPKALATALALAAVVASTSAARAEEYTAVVRYPMPTPAGFNGGVSGAASGQAVQNIYNPSAPPPSPNHAVLWNPDGSSVNLTPAGFAGSYAYGTDGTHQFGIVYPGGTQLSLPVVWNGTAASATFLPLGGFKSADVQGSSGNGQFVGVSGITADEDTHALLWTSTSSQPINLNPTNLPGFTFCSAYGAGGGKQVGSGSITGAGGIMRDHALLWSGSANSAVDLNPTNLPDITDSIAVATDGVQQVGFGASYQPGTAHPPHAMLWNGTADSAVDLHPPGFEYTSSYTWAVRNGIQVGVGLPVFGTSDALLWRGTAESVINLSEFLPDGFAWAWARATYVDDAGHVFGVAYNFADQLDYAIEWVPVPEPALFGLLLSLAPAALLRRRRALSHSRSSRLRSKQG